MQRQAYRRNGPLQKLRRVLVCITIGILGLIVLPMLVFFIYCNFFCSISTPQKTSMPAFFQDSVVVCNDTTRLKGNWLCKNESGLYELYVEGSPLERGCAFGKLCKNLLYQQELSFTSEIDQWVPNHNYQKLLKSLIIFFNRNLGSYIPEENKEEIYALSQSCSHDFDYICPPYERQMNFHSAHDLGHAMQDYMLVGCSSFAAWDDESKNHELIVGRNFDFYVGDDFAKNKIVMFVNPTEGYSFAMVTWAGMTGVCSGMNMKGITVTINAAKSDMPTSSATPISILARRILQYASSIEEAYHIADTTHTYVSESILIGSGKENKAAIIEKAVNHTALYEVKEGHHITCTNHYQSKDFANDINNMENIQNSDSKRRQERLEQLIQQNYPIGARKAAEILRDRDGLNGEKIGNGNELALNQLIAHHSVIFSPRKLTMWVSTSPWQLGEYVSYNLEDVFLSKTHSLHHKQKLNIPADSFLQTNEFKNYLQFRKEQKAVQDSLNLTKDDLNKFIALNPNYYYTYEVAGNASLRLGRKEDAVTFWQKALSLEIPKKNDSLRITEKIKKIIDK